MWAFLDDLANSLTLEFIFPALIFAVLMFITIVVIFRAQSRKDFDVANMLRDETGKESALRMGVLVSLALSSWGIASMVLTKTLTPDYWLAYLFTWSGALVFVKAVEKWDGRLPFAKTGDMPSTTVTTATTTVETPQPPFTGGGVPQPPFDTGSSTTPPPFRGNQ